MSARIVEVNGTQVVFGLDWVPLSGDGSEKDEVVQIVKSNKAAYQVRCAADHAILFGFLAKADVPDDVKNPKFKSAAALLASFPDVAANAIWIEVDGQTAKMAALRDGLPLPLGDFYGSVMEADDRIRHIEADSGISFTFYGNYSEVYESSVPISLAELCDEGSSEVATLVKASRSTDKRMLVIGAVALALAAWQYGGDVWRFVHPPKKVEKVDATKQYLQQLPSRLAMAGTVAPVAARFIHGDWSKETLQAGWFLTKVSCSIAQCSYAWNIVGGDGAALERALGTRNIMFSPDGQQALVTLENQPAPQTPLSSDRLPSTAEFRRTQGSFAQDLSLLNVSFQFGDTKLFGADNPSAIDLNKLHGAIRSGDFKVTGKAAVFDDVLRHLPDSVTLDSMDLTITGIDPVFELRGSYYVKD
ncbi:type 4b pilus protein PilO2 [Caballeronia sp. EK]|uniref:type 4b pilus protein PilO2 n=1 Tax=Caballeronia sp. EK TaxID=2767469 RepID=UPI0016557C46|nr:type 4b pilus protein PilO2 [Caballeronia sp. EK]MBC8641694.1 type 4b pilus protein PilO2 [Caballeronia sp. EK]